jgi:hypothetical protein
VAGDRMTLDLNRPRPRCPGEAAERRRLESQGPEFLGLPPSLHRRGNGSGWTPLATTLLARHRAVDRLHLKHSNSTLEPRGYRLDRVLGLVRSDPQPTTRRLTLAGERLLAGDSGSEPPLGEDLLGHVEQTPFPLMVALELRRLRATGQDVLVAGEGDPLRAQSDLLEEVGWIEPVPMEPRVPVEHTACWGLSVLTRAVDLDARRHRYAITAHPPPGATSLGSVWQRPSERLVPLVSDGDRLTSPLLAPPGPTATAAQRITWAAAPLRWGGAVAGLKGAVGRGVSQLALRRRRESPGGQELLGWIRPEPARGWSALFSSVHPVVGDQFVTRSALEATDLGYRLTGILGYICDRGAHLPPEPDVPWASRFGRSRRYVEGPLPEP